MGKKKKRKVVQLPVDGIKRGDQYWCWWMSRTLIFLRVIGEFYLFEDFGDARIMLTADEVRKLTAKD